MPIGGRRRGGLVRTAARTAAIAWTASAVSGRVQHRQQERWAAQAAPQPPAPTAAPSEDDVIDQIERLGELREKGLLTDEEFAAQKAKLLG